MNQFRTILIIAWLMVATLLWFEWTKEQAQPPQTATPAAAATPATTAPATTPPATTPPATATPAGTASAPLPPGAAAPQVGAVPSQQPAITLSNDVLRLTLDGGSVRRAELLRYRVERKPDAPLVRLFDDGAETFYIAQSGWISGAGAPGPEGGFVLEGQGEKIELAKGANEVAARFVWTGNDGVSIRRTYTLKRGSYALTVRDEIVNRGAQAWTGYIFRQLKRLPQNIEYGMTNPESFVFHGAAWYTPGDKYEKRKYDAFVDDGLQLNRSVGGGWIALLQHYFVTAWVPQPDQKANFDLSAAGDRFGIVATGPQITVAAGGQDSSQATLWIGPKLPQQLEATAPGLDLTLDYGIFTLFAEPIHWLLAKLHTVTGNWGWAIVLLVVLIKLAMYPLSAAQYRSAARMRKLQPRVQQLRERYGEDKQKFQMAMLELYKKEKVNPAGGCLPVLIQMPVFLALYWVLIESVELRQAPWMLWINDLTARDPYFILPLINVAVMWYTQKMTPMVGVDPVQQRMFQLMPLIFGVMFALFPAGLVLYWVTNGALGMAQQWWTLRQHGENNVAAKR